MVSNCSNFPTFAVLIHLIPSSFLYFTVGISALRCFRIVRYLRYFKYFSNGSEPDKEGWFTIFTLAEQSSIFFDRFCSEIFSKRSTGGLVLIAAVLYVTYIVAAIILNMPSISQQGECV